MKKDFFMGLRDGIPISLGYLSVSFGFGILAAGLGLSVAEAVAISALNLTSAGQVAGVGIIAASNMAGVPRKMTDFFASKSTMNFLGIPTMSLGNVNPEDDSYSVEIRETGNSYKKIVHKNGKITGAILQGDLAYGGILQQLIANHIDVTRVKKPIFDVDYSDFFNIKENFEYYYEEQ